MASSRTLNGIGNNQALNFALLKQNNLSDLTNVPNARINLGLVGTLSSGGNISLSDYNGTQNRLISAVGTTNSTPNTLVAYNASGNINTTSIITPSITTTGTTISLNSKNLTSVGNITANSIKTNTFRSTSDSADLMFFIGTSITENFRISTNGACESLDFTAFGSIFSDTYRPYNAGPITFKNSSGANTATLDEDGNFAAEGNVGAEIVGATTEVRSPAYKSLLFSNISFKNYSGIEVAHIKQTGEYVGSNQVTVIDDNNCCINLNCTATGSRNWRIVSTHDGSLGGAGNFQIWNQTNNVECLRIVGLTNSVSITETLIAKDLSITNDIGCQDVSCRNIDCSEISCNGLIDSIYPMWITRPSGTVTITTTGTISSTQWNYDGANTHNSSVSTFSPGIYINTAGYYEISTNVGMVKSANFAGGDYCQGIVKIMANINGVNTTIGQYEARAYNAVVGSYIFQLTCSAPPTYLNALDYVYVTIDTLRNAQSIVMDANSYFSGKLICRDA